MGEVLKQKHYLNLLAKSKNKSRRNALIDLATKSEINSVCECLLNALENNFEIPAFIKKGLKRKKRNVHATLIKSSSIKRKKHNLKQIGGFLTSLIPLAIQVASALLPKLLSK